MNTIEVEIKSLLGHLEKAETLIAQMKKHDSSLKLRESSSQLNHYFIGGDISLLQERIDKWTDKKIRQSIKKVAQSGKSYSVRTRKHNDDSILIIKSTIDDTTSENGTARIEIEIPMPEHDIHELDDIVLKSQFQYQAKWSRKRQEYQYKKYSVCIDKNAGYGYLAEFEYISTDQNSIERIKKELREELQILEIEELNQERLQRMFEYYNSHWQEYYGTDKIFTIY